MITQQSSIIPGYSPSAVTSQQTPYLRTPGAQGLTEGVSGGQGVGNTPTQQFYGAGGQGSAAPSSVPNAAAQWSAFGGSGEAPSSFAQQQTGSANGAMSIPQVITALGSNNGTTGTGADKALIAVG